MESHLVRVYILIKFGNEASPLKPGHTSLIQFAAMVRIAIFALVASSPLASAWNSYRNNRAFLSTEMQPDVVAKTLSHVENEWKMQAREYIACQSNPVPTPESTEQGCDVSPVAFGKSCGTVVDAIVQGSSGNPKVMNEYMEDVCGQKVMESWHQTICNSLAKAIIEKITSSNYDNRVNFQAGKVCTEFWSTFFAEEKASYDKEQTAMKAEEDEAAERMYKEATEMREKAASEKKEMDAELEKDNSVKEDAEIDEEKKEVVIRAKETAERNVEQRAVESQVNEITKAAESAEKDASQLEEESAKLNEESKAVQSRSN